MKPTRLGVERVPMPRFRPLVASVRALDSEAVNYTRGNMTKQKTETIPSEPREPIDWRKLFEEARKKYNRSNPRPVCAPQDGPACRECQRAIEASSDYTHDEAALTLTLHAQRPMHGFRKGPELVRFEVVLSRDPYVGSKLGEVTIVSPLIARPPSETPPEAT